MVILTKVRRASKNENQKTQRPQLFTIKLHTFYITFINCNIGYSNIHYSKLEYLAPNFTIPENIRLIMVY